MFFLVINSEATVPNILHYYPIHLYVVIIIVIILIIINIIIIIVVVVVFSNIKSFFARNIIFNAQLITLSNFKS